MATVSWAQTGLLRNIAISPKNDSAGVGTTYLFSFESDSGLKRDDKILLYFPKGKGFDLSEALVANNKENLDGGFDVSVDTTEALIGLQRDGHGVDLPPNTTGSFRVAIIGNPTGPGSYSIMIITQRGANALNQGQGTATIKAGPLDHFNFTNIGNQVADSLFSFTITAKDAYNNNRPLSNVKVDLSDNTGTFSPLSVTMNNFSFNIGNAKISKGQSGVRITATANNGKVVSASNAFGVNQIKILGIDAAPTTVSRGQTNIPVTMTVQNLGPNDVTVTKDSLTFIGNAAGYSVTSTSLPVVIPGNLSIRTLAFSVNVGAGALLGKRLIDGKVFGAISSGAPLSDLNADAKDSIIVQTPPSLSEAANSLNPSQVSTGSFFQFRVGIRNNGQATLELNPAATTFQFAAAGQTFITALDATGGATLIGNGQTKTLIFQSKQISSTIPKGVYTPQVILNGTQNGAAFSQSVTLSNNLLTVGDPPTFQIVAVRASQDTVTRNMRKPWSISLRVKNNTTATVTFDRAELQFYQLGNNSPDAFYRFTPPTSFALGHPAIVPSGVDSVVYQIDTTGQMTGVVAIFAKVFVREFPLDPAESNGTQKSILAQTPAQLNVRLSASQATVTQGQTRPWKVTMNVDNAGESAVRIILNGDSTRTSLASAGHSVSPLSGAIVLAGKNSRNLDFVVTATSDTAQSRQTIHGQVNAYEINSDSLHFADTFNNGSTQVTVQTPAVVALDAAKLVEVFNGDTVNVGQNFSVQVGVKQTQGTEKVDSVRVRLSNANGNNANILEDTLAVANGLNQPVSFKLTANNVAPKQAQFKANIVEAFSANTRANTVLFDGNSKNVSAYIQRKGNLQLDKITTSENIVRFGRTAPWSIAVEASNPAPSKAGAVVIDSTIFTFKIGANVQRDYTVEKIAGGSLLFGGEKDTLIFNVTKTGTTSGTVTITATVYFHNKNSLEKASVSKTTTIIVESTALATIAKTSFPASVNRLGGTEIALVNTGQVFPVNVTVRNSGFEKIDAVWVTLATKGGSTITTKQMRIGPIDTETGTAVATFTVKADEAVNKAGEIFSAQIDSAKNFFGAKVGIGRPLDANDTTAVARIELPARLQLSLTTGDGSTSFGLNQQFKMRARVKNLGEAQTDKSGVLKINLPRPKNANAYQLVGNEPDAKNFAAGDSVEWLVKAPSQASQLDTFVVEITNPPLDKNSGQFAEAVKTKTDLIVSTLNSTINLTAAVTAPAGATDGIISTEQSFTVGANISTSSNLANKKATLNLPAGFSFVTGEQATKDVPANGVVAWMTQAPTQANASPVDLEVRATAVDGQNQPQQASRKFSITTKSRAILNMTAGISEPLGARGGTLAVGQSFVIFATLANTGEAKLEDTVYVKLDRGATNIAINAPLQRAVVFKPDSQVKTIYWPAVAPNQPTPSSPLTFSLLRFPLDENTKKPALATKNSALFDIVTVDTGVLFAAEPRLTAPDSAKDRIVSTGQEFTISDSLSWTNAANLTAELVAPPNASFTIFNSTQSLNATNEMGNTKMAWIVRAPAAPIDQARFRVIFRATDAHNNALPLIYQSDSLEVKVVQRAELALSVAITEPPSATLGVVSAGQPFKVVATLRNVGAAGVYDTAKVSLALPDGYSLVDSQESLLKAARLPEQNTFAWMVKARADISEIADQLLFKLEQPPRDANTQAFAAINDGETALGVRIEGRRFVIETLNKGGGPAAQGEQNLLLLQLKLMNPARGGSSNLLLNQLSFDLRNRAGELVPPNAALKAVRVMRQPNGILCGEAASLAANNPVIVSLTNNVSVSPDKPDTIAIMVDVLESTNVENFRLVFDDSQDFTVIDEAGGIGIVVETPEGNRGNNLNLVSNLLALVGADPEKAFFNFPNPFQPGGDKINGQGTHFAYNLPEAAAGELKIFTLLGELVWQTSFSEIDRAGNKGFHRFDIFWDGRNGADKLVLNGVYIAMLRVNGGKTYTTKVAVLKK
jgi:hypothetical protein